MFTPADLELFAAIKLVFWIFSIGACLFYIKKWPNWLFLLFFGATQSVAYLLLVHGTVYPFWGLVGDEVFISAMFNAAAHTGFGDFAYAGLPAFYPPFFFGVFGIIGNLLDLNGVQLSKLAALSVFFLLPIGVYCIQQWYWKDEAEDTPFTIAWVVGSIMLFVLLPTATIILKPYEVVSAFGIIIWTVFLVRDIHKDRCNWIACLAYGLTGGVLFMTFYFWFILVAIGIAFYHASLRKKISVSIYSRFALVGIITLLVSLPYIYPLVRSYVTIGSENWQLGFTVLDRLATVGPGIEWSLVGLISLFGLGTMLYYRGQFYMRILLSLFAASYVWYGLGLVLIVLFQTPIQEDKGFLYFNSAILALAVGYGVQQVVKKIKIAHPSIVLPLVLISIWLTAFQLIFGTFADDPNVQAVRLRSTSFHSGEQSLIGYLESQENLSETVTLTSGMGFVHAFLPIKTFHYINIHASHPAALFSQRIGTLRSLSSGKDAEMFYNQSQNTIFGSIDRFVFFNTNVPYYEVFYHADGYPNGIQEQSIQFSKDLFAPEFFERVYESKDFIVFEPRK